MRRTSLALAMVASAALLSGCGSDGNYDESIRDEVALQPVGSCSELEQRIEDEAEREMSAAIDSLIRSGGGPVILAADGAPTAAPAPAATEYSTTNTQEAGVDEADFVKNDGSRIFVLEGQRLNAVAAWPPEQTRLSWSLPLEGWPRELLYSADQVVVFAAVNLAGASGAAGVPWPPASFDGRATSLPCHPGACADGTKISVLDVSGPEPRVLREHYLGGSYLTSRRIGTSVHVVTSGALRGPRLRYYPDVVNWQNPEAVADAYLKLKRENAAAIRGAKLSDWLPTRIDAFPGQPARAVEASCSAYLATDAPVYLGHTTVSTLRLGGDASLGQTVLLNGSDQAYASTGALYLTAPHRWLRPWERKEVPDHSYVHRLDLASDPTRVRAAGSGGVPGTVLNQFAMDEENGHLRLATTRSDFDRGTTTSGVYVLAIGQGRLSKVGEVTGLAAGERIQSVRFEGRRGYVVTFRQIDPLFTLDLADPSRPRVVGELKIPGFSSYIHPLDEGHLLTIGFAGENGWQGSVELKVFDVSDLANPRVMHSFRPGTPSGASEATWDAKAFTYFRARGLLAIPFSDWLAGRRGGFRSTLELFRVGVAEGIVPLGEVDHADLLGEEERGWGWTPQVRRGVFLEDYVYSISHGGVKVTPVARLDSVLATVPFPAP